MPDRVEAELVYDTKTQPLASGIRAAVQRARRLLFTAEDTELVLQIAADRQPERVRLVGQVLDEGVPVEGAAVSLHGPSVIERETDEEGEFRVGELPKGSYGLEVETETRVVAVLALDMD